MIARSRSRRNTAARKQPNGVVLKTTGELEWPLQNLGRLGEVQRYWTYVVGNRQRMSDEARQQLRNQSREHLLELGTQEDTRADFLSFLQQVAERGVVEVSIPFTAEDIGWEYRTVPWESLLSLATKQWRGERHLVVVRHCIRPDLTSSAPASPSKLLLIASSPGILGVEYEFWSELRLIASCFSPALQESDTTRRSSMTPQQLQELVQNEKPHLIHLTGVDAHQGAELLNLPPDPKRYDGFYLSTQNNEPFCVDSELIGHCLTGNQKFAPLLVSFNCYHSAARLAAMCVARGVQMAIGFQDTIDDTIAERFFATFYSRCQEYGWSEVLRAFIDARNELVTEFSSLPSERQGGDVVLWTCRSLLTSFSEPSRLASSTVPTVIEIPISRASLEPQIEKLDPSSALEVKIDPIENLNYSLLHNNRSPFRVFQIKQIQSFDSGHQPEVEIEVRIDAGGTEIPFQIVQRLQGPLTDISKMVHLPLVSSVFSQSREGVYTTMLVEVRCKAVTLHRHTYRISLLPFDEWTDDDSDRQWLPSFVMPRDLAVQRFLEPASRYLRALADDSSAGFDGYQSAALSGGSDTVDWQVRAIWSALLYETPLVYINPPPTYTRRAQRVRTPSQILAERRGTCLDVALLFAACLEYIGLMPVIFLIRGHAFPGYWRKVEARDALVGFQNVPIDESTSSSPKASPVPTTGPRFQWIITMNQFDEIVPHLTSGDLVPVETTELTRRGSFASALELGQKNLLTGWNFDAMVDIQSARDANVTPLPLRTA